MKVQFIISWVLRGLGVLAVLCYFFGGAKLGQLFPGLIGKSLGPVFYAGVVLYIAGAVYYRFLFSKERKEREKSRREEERKAQASINAEKSEVEK